VLPGLYVACAALLAPVARTAPRAVLAFATVLVAVNIAVFVAADTPFSASAIASHDRSLDLRIAFVRSHMDPTSAVILAQFEYLTARYYLPDYRVLFYGSDPEVLSRAAREMRLASPTTVVIFGALAAPLPSALRLTTDVAPSGIVEGGTTLVAFDLEPH
jgi:hypothetical protein